MKQKIDYQSQDIGGYSITQIDSLSYQYSDSAFIGRIGNVISWENKIAIEDLNFKKVWIFNSDLTILHTIIGKRGSGPGEYKSAAIP